MTDSNFRTAATIGGLLFALSASSVAKAATPVTAYYGISSFDMTPVSSDIQYDSTDSLRLTGGLSGCFNTALHLPQSAQMTELQVWFGAGYGMNVMASLNLTNLSNPSGTGQVFYKQFTTNDVYVVDSRTGRVAIPDLYYAHVDNRKYAYGFRICLNGTATAFFSARITYTYNQPGT